MSVFLYQPDGFSSLIFAGKFYSTCQCRIFFSKGIPNKFLRTKGERTMIIHKYISYFNNFQIFGVLRCSNFEQLWSSTSPNCFQRVRGFMSRVSPF